MRYLRGEEIDIELLSKDSLKKFREHCDYFLLPPPKSLSTKNKFLPDESTLKLEIDGAMATVEEGTGKDWEKTTRVLTSPVDVTSIKFRFRGYAFGVYEHPKSQTSRPSSFCLWPSDFMTRMKELIISW